MVRARRPHRRRWSIACAPDGKRAAVVSFPRYGDTIGGHVLGELLSGRLPRGATPESQAVLYALDRFESRDHVAAVAAANDVVVFDRYVASNMAYQAARVSGDEADRLMEWILALETGRVRAAIARSVGLSRYPAGTGAGPDPAEATAFLYRPLAG